MSAWNFIDLTGQKFGDLTVLQRGPDKITKRGDGIVQWECQCICGKIVLVHSIYLRRGEVRSCGCRQREHLSETLRKTKGKNKNHYDLSGEYGIGYTSKNEPFWFDLEDYALISQYTWSYRKHYLVTRYMNKTIRFHRLVLGIVDSKIIIDHIIHGNANENKFDNRKNNLRIVTASQNGMNSSLSKNNTSGIKGITYNKKAKRWVASIQVNNKYIYLGSFKEKEDAAQARKKAEQEYFKEYSYEANNSIETKEIS